MFGAIGMLCTDRDSDYIPGSLALLNSSLECLLQKYSDFTLIFIVSIRRKDTQARQAVIKNAPIYCKLIFIETDYDFEFVHHHTDEILDVICIQRNVVVNQASRLNCEFLFFLDSDILLQYDSLIRLFETGKDCVSCSYRPRWAEHTIVGVECGNTELGESAFQLLLNPQALKCDDSVFPVALMGAGAMLIKKSLFHIPFRVAESQGGVKGEDIGFFIDIRSAGFEAFCLANHSVGHINGGVAPYLWIPYIGRSTPLLSHCKASQLRFLEESAKLEWRPLLLPPHIKQDQFHEYFQLDSIDINIIVFEELRAHDKLY